MSVCFVGPSGSGKSSLIRQRLGFEFDSEYRPTLKNSKWLVSLPSGKRASVVDFGGQEMIGPDEFEILKKSNLVVICWSTLHNKSIEKVCKTNKLNYVVVQLKCDDSRDWTQHKFSCKSRNSCVDFWTVVEEAIAKTKH